MFDLPFGNANLNILPIENAMKFSYFFSVRMCFSVLLLFLFLISFGQTDTISAGSDSYSFRLEGSISGGITGAFLNHPDFKKISFVPRYTFGFHLRPKWNSDFNARFYPMAGIVQSLWITSNSLISGTYRYEERFLFSITRLQGGIEWKIRRFSVQLGAYAAFRMRRYNATRIYEEKQIIYEQLHPLRHSFLFLNHMALFLEWKFHINTRWNISVWSALPPGKYPLTFWEAKVYYKLF